MCSLHNEKTYAQLYIYFTVRYTIYDAFFPNDMNIFTKKPETKID